MALIFEICYIYYAKPEAMQPMEEGRPEERTAQNFKPGWLAVSFKVEPYWNSHMAIRDGKGSMK
jgi:hypothetical protein